MGSFTSRQNAAIEEAEQQSGHAYKYPPASGHFFGTHFIMGGERFDTPLPEVFLFGENADLNFLGNRPTAFPYPPPQTNEPTKTLKSLVNIRKESVRFVRAGHDKKSISEDAAAADVVVPPTTPSEQVDGNVLTSCILGEDDAAQKRSNYNIEFTFDADAKCAITIYYFCTEEESPSGITLVPRDGLTLTSETYHYGRGIGQFFSQPSHIFNPHMIPKDDLIYSPTKEQYPVAIHCVAEEGNEECRQSHTTICVIDHHADTNSYVLRALKQKIFVDGLSYLLQEIYGIENKAVNKSSIDEDIDDHGSECVICMSESRDTLILPCRHLCLCTSCADSLRYQANNCPICRAPFRALLQIRAVQKGISLQQLAANNAHAASGGTGDAPQNDQHMPPGYVPIPLIEALNGPPQYVIRTIRHSDADITDGHIIAAAANLSENQKPTSPTLNKSGQRRQKSKKHATTSTNTSDVGTITTTTASSINAAQTIESNDKNASTASSAGGLEKRASQDKLQIVNERHSLKLPKAAGNKRHSTASNNAVSVAALDDADDDSENEKLSPLLSPGSKSKPMPAQMLKAMAGLNDGNESTAGETDNENVVAAAVPMPQSNSTSSFKKKQTAAQAFAKNTADAVVIVNAEDAEYYAPEDAHNSILSPLCPVGIKSGGNSDKFANLKLQTGSFKGVANSLAAAKKQQHLHKKSTSVGNIVGPGAGNASIADLKAHNVSSLPDMLDSPISGNSASTRSSSDSYSSSSSTKQLLAPNTTNPAAANIIVDDKTSLQNAVNV